MKQQCQTNQGSCVQLSAHEGRKLLGLQHYNIDALGDETETSRISLITISGDTSINGKRYFIFEGTNDPYNSSWEIIDFIRDSIGVLNY